MKLWLLINYYVTFAVTDPLLITHVGGHNEYFWVVEDPIQFKSASWAETFPRIVQTGLTELARDRCGFLSFLDTFGTFI